MATILLAEDNEAVRLLTQAKLRHQFTVVTAANGREALDILNRQHVDLIVADVMMPVMDGYSITQSSKIIAADTSSISDTVPRVRDESIPVNNALTPNRLLTAATNTGSPINQVICFPADWQRVS